MKTPPDSAIMMVDAGEQTDAAPGIPAGQSSGKQTMNRWRLYLFGLIFVGVLAVFATFAVWVELIDREPVPAGMPAAMLSGVHGEQDSVLCWRVDQIDGPSGEDDFLCTAIELAKMAPNQWMLLAAHSDHEADEWPAFHSSVTKVDPTSEQGEPVLIQGNQTFDHRPSNEEILRFLDRIHFFTDNNAIVDAAVVSASWQKMVGSPPPIRFSYHLRAQALLRQLTSEYSSLDD